MNIFIRDQGYRLVAFKMQKKRIFWKAGGKSLEMIKSLKEKSSSWVERWTQSEAIGGAQSQNLQKKGEKARNVHLSLTDPFLGHVEYCC